MSSVIHNWIRLKMENQHEPIGWQKLFVCLMFCSGVSFINIPWRYFIAPCNIWIPVQWLVRFWTIGVISTNKPPSITHNQRYLFKGPIPLPNPPPLQTKVLGGNNTGITLFVHLAVLIHTIPPLLMKPTQL